ncbi:MAG: SelB C-terminal domain-containing protein, partial [Anaerolineae bacterium]|nr:SelB C-terminal domain-containing protein [Anaerolineae bacterium]
VVLEALAKMKVLDYGRWVKLPGKGMTFTKTQRQAVNDLLAECDADPYSPPSYKDAAKKVSDEVLKALLAQGELIYLRPDVLLRPAAYQAMLGYAREQLEQGEGLTVAGLRDHFDTSRRIALPFLDYLEAHNITRRVDDTHVLKTANWDAVNMKDR